MSANVEAFPMFPLCGCTPLTMQGQGHSQSGEMLGSEAACFIGDTPSGRTGARFGMPCFRCPKSGQSEATVQFLDTSVVWKRFYPQCRDRRTPFAPGSNSASIPSSNPRLDLCRHSSLVFPGSTVRNLYRFKKMSYRGDTFLRCWADWLSRFFVIKLDQPPERIAAEGYFLAQ